MTLPLLPTGNPAVIFFLPAGFADTDAAPIPFLADPIDPVTGELLSIEQGFDPIDSAVITSIRTERASGSAVEDTGQQFRKAKRVDDTLPQFLRLETGLALKHLIDAGDIDLQKVTTAGAGDAGTVAITYRAVNSNDPRPLQAPTGLAASS